MALSSDPSVTYNAAGNILATTTSIAGGGSNSTGVVDASANSLGAWVQVTATGGATVAATNGCQVSVFPAGDSTPHYDTIAMWSFVIPMTVSTAARASILLPTGKYSIALANLDGTNAITAGITSNPDRLGTVACPNSVGRSRLPEPGRAPSSTSPSHARSPLRGG